MGLPVSDRQAAAGQATTTVVADKEAKTEVVIDVAIPVDNNIRKKEHEKIQSRTSINGADMEGKVQSGQTDTPPPTKKKNKSFTS